MNDDVYRRCNNSEPRFFVYNMYHQTNNTNHVFMNKLLRVKWLGMLPSV